METIFVAFAWPERIWVETNQTVVDLILCLCVRACVRACKQCVCWVCSHTFASGVQRWVFSKAMSQPQCEKRCRLCCSWQSVLVEIWMSAMEIPGKTSSSRQSLGSKGSHGAKTKPATATPTTTPATQKLKPNVTLPLNSKNTVKPKSDKGTSFFLRETSKCLSLWSFSQDHFLVVSCS